LILFFEKFEQRGDGQVEAMPEWVFKQAITPQQNIFKDNFGHNAPSIASYTTDSRDYVYDVSYSLNDELFEHVFARAKERAGLPKASDEIVRNYLKGALENLMPKVMRNYKVAIPVYFIKENKMQMLLPFEAADGLGVSAFLVERDDARKVYKLKTILDMDHAYFAARLITRPDKDWLDP
ncbi:MAG: hypothetical protein C0405_05330, partial [Desulfovibrio sp.]|nr:hypothetical protein [Desulfovibrio sp.]